MKIQNQLNNISNLKESNISNLKESNNHGNKKDSKIEHKRQRQKNPQIH